DAELALDRVRRRQQLRRRAWLGAHRVDRSRRDQLVGRIRLAAFELLDAERPGEVRQLALQMVLKRRDVERVALSHGLRADELLHRFHLLPLAHRSAIASSLSRDNTTSRVGSTRTAPCRSKPLSSWLTRWR